MSQKEKSDQKDIFPLNRISIWLLIIAGLFCLFACFSPLIFTCTAISKIDFNSTGQIGDTIGGLASPFLALASIVVTFLAFYIQYQANEQQKKNLRDTLIASEKQNQIDKFEKQFYEMLRLHKENVNEISLNISYVLSDSTDISTYSPTIEKHERINGRLVFKYYLKELEILYHKSYSFYGDENAAIWNAYTIFLQELIIIIRKMEQILQKKL